MQERLDLGPCRAIRHTGDERRCVVLLPGQFYPTRAPVLWFAREAAMSRGWSALEILDEPGEHDDPLGWERDCAERAIEAAGQARVLVIGKSLASLLAGEIAERDLPAVWLTPLLNEVEVIDGLTRTRRPVLLVGGDGDPTWQLDALPDHPALDVLELPGADHSVHAQLVNCSCSSAPIWTTATSSKPASTNALIASTCSSTSGPQESASATCSGVTNCVADSNESGRR